MKIKNELPIWLLTIIYIIGCGCIGALIGVIVGLLLS